MTKVLVVEDSKMFAKVITDKIINRLEIECVAANSMEEAQRAVEDTSNTFAAAVLDLNLPDAPHGEIVDYIMAKEIPSIVLTGTLSDETRETILEKTVTDYVLKEGFHSIDMVVQGVQRIIRNSKRTVLIVDDSKISRMILKKFLTIQQFAILEASNGKEALEILSENPHISMVITDYNMPIMDGFELVTAIRKSYTMDEMAIIGISSQGNPMLSAKFLKSGANDFVTKPFAEEEFFWRVNQSVELLDYIEKVRNAATLDYLTNLYNRRYFFEIGEKLFENVKREHLSISVAIMDIDHFKTVNDTHGHDCGDAVLKTVAKILKNSFRSSDVVARYGGEEFCVIATNASAENCFDIFEKLRKKIEETKIHVNGRNINITVSIGVQSVIAETLEATIKKADVLLYEAKESGRNKVLVSRY